MSEPDEFDLDDPFPDFLRHLDGEAAPVMQAFSDFFRAWMREWPPKKLWEFPASEHEDEIHELFRWLVRDRFAVVRRYHDLGLPFAVWLSDVANNRLRDRLRARRRRELRIVRELPVQLPDPSTETPARREVLEKIRVALGRLDVLCRLLLRARYEDRRPPRQILVLLGWPSGRSVELGQMIRKCLRGLGRKLGELGIGRDGLGVFG